MRTLAESKVLSFSLVLRENERMGSEGIKGVREGSESKISLCYPRGLGASPQSFHKRGGVT